MKVLVIGSGGYMGRHLMAGLAAVGVEAVGCSTSDGTGLNPTSGLLTDGFSVPLGTESIVYLAQSPRYREVPEQAAHVLAVNSFSAIRAAALARAAGVLRFIYLSTGTVYAPSFAPLGESAPVRRDGWYTLSKLHGEEALALFRPYMDVIIVRPFGIFGPQQSGRLVPNLIQSVKAGQPIKLQTRPDSTDGNDGLIISLCYIDDATRILIDLLKNGGPACLNLAGAEALSIRAMGEMIGFHVGCKPVFELSLTPRDSDLVADIDLLARTVSPTFTPFPIGLTRVINSI